MPADPNRILIVEDDAGLAELLGDGLRRRGLCVDTAGSGREGLTWLSHHEADLLLIDYSLPDMTGAAMVEEMVRARRMVPFVVITGHGDEEVAVRLMKLGALDYLVKDARLLDILPGTTLRVLKEVGTQRRLAAAEDSVREKEQRYRHLLASVTDYVYSVQIKDGRAVATSHGPGCVKVTGFSPEEYAANPGLWLEMVHPEDRAAVQQHAQAVNAGELLPPIEHRIRHKDSSLRWVQNTMVPERDAEGRLVACDGMIADITVRKQAQEALAEALSMQRAIFESTADLIFSVNSRDFGLATYNTALETYFLEQRGIRLRVGLRPDDLFPDAYYIELWNDLYREALASGSVMKEYATYSGTKTLLLSLNVLRREGIPYGVSVFGKDITERKRAEAALTRDEAELATIYDHAPVMMLLISADLKVRRLNRAAAEFAGKSTADSLGLRPGDLLGCLHALDDPRGCGFGPDCGVCPLRNAVLDTQRTGATHQRIETRPHFVRGREVVDVTLLASTARLQVDGESTVLLCLEDVSQQKLAEQRVREQAALLDVTLDAIFVIDLDDLVTYWNRSAGRIYGWSSAEAIGRKIHDLFPAVDEVDEGATIRRSIWEKGEWMGELRRSSRAGKPLRIQRRANLMRDHRGEPCGVLLVDTDVTEAKRLEEQFLRAQRLDSLGSLAGGVAHDLNNVFTPIMMSIEMLRGLTREARDQEMVQLLGDSTHRGADIVRQLLLFSRGSDSPRTEVNLALVIRELRRMMQETFPKNITLAVQAPSDLWAVHGDQTQLHQVLLNLCVNARDAMPNGGRLVVAAENVHVDQVFASQQLNAQPGPHVFLRVSDNGTGIPPECIEKIFDPFFTTKPLGQGTGLGLSASLGIVRSHGGFITVRSEPGAGSEFGVYLPAKAAAVGISIDDAVRQALCGQGELVLVVDDEANIRCLVERALQNHGYEVVCVSGGAEAVSFIAAHGGKVRLVVTDVLMPGMDGLQVVRELRRRLPQLPVVAISGTLGHRAEFEKLQPPRVRHLAKPFTIEALLTEVRDALDETAATGKPAAPRGEPDTTRIA